MRTILVAAALAGAASAVLGSQAPPLVRVAAASDLRFALQEVAARLAARERPLRVEAVYGSSGNLHAQLRQRAPYDLFLSADIAYPADLVAHGVGAKEDLFTYAQGRLVLWVASGSPLPIERDRLAALRTARRVAMANPAHAPYGRAAEAALRGAGVWDAVRSRLLLAENIAQAAQFVQSGAADAGLIARSLAVAAPMRGAGRFVEVPADAHPPLMQGGLVPAHAANRAGALAVRDYLVGAAGRELLARNGFDVAGAR
jgi:molybdate transport system substrate-binding protein